MNLKKRTYRLPEDTVDRFEHAVPPGGRSAVVSRLIEQWLAQNLSKQEREQLRADIIEGCRDMAELNLEIEKEWHPLEEEVARKYPDG